MILNILVPSDIPLTLPTYVRYEELLQDVLTPIQGVSPPVTPTIGNESPSYDQFSATDEDYNPTPRPPTRRSTRTRKTRVKSLYGSYVGPSLNA